MKKAHLALAFALLLPSAGAVLAQTPDGQPPSEETVCDNESGAAYGLCTAYCEAMDCDSDTPHASATACSKVRNKFMQFTGRDLPCQAVVCPCNDPAVNPLFADTVAGRTVISSCTSILGVILSLSPSGSVSAVQGRCDAFGFPSLPTTPEQQQLCIQLLEQAAANQNVTCN